MAQSSWRSLREHLHRLAGSRAVEESSDADLLLRWINLRDEAAFELLVWRHGGMVLDLCQRMLSSASEAEDAFQATFLVLVKKAKSVRQREPWLVGSTRWRCGSPWPPAPSPRAAGPRR